MIPRLYSEYYVSGTAHSAIITPSPSPLSLCSPQPAVSPDQAARRTPPALRAICCLPLASYQM